MTVVLAGERLSGGAATAARRSRAIEEAEAAGALVFHAGTALHGDRLVTNGGRILGVTGLGPTIARGARRAPTPAARGSRSRRAPSLRHRRGGGWRAGVAMPRS